MSCESVARDLTLYLYGELSGEDEERVEAHLLAVGEEFIELRDHLGVDVRVAQELDQRPGGRARGGVVPREHHRDEHPGDLQRSY